MPSVEIPRIHTLQSAAEGALVRSWAEVVAAVSAVLEASPPMTGVTLNERTSAVWVLSIEQIDGQAQELLKSVSTPAHTWTYTMHLLVYTKFGRSRICSAQHILPVLLVGPRLEKDLVSI